MRLIFEIFPPKHDMQTKFRPVQPSLHLSIFLHTQHILIISEGNQKGELGTWPQIFLCPIYCISQLAI